MSTRVHDQNDDIVLLRALIDRIYQEQAEASRRAELASAAAVDNLAKPPGKAARRRPRGLRGLRGARALRLRRARQGGAQRQRGGGALPLLRRRVSAVPGRGVY